MALWPLKRRGVAASALALTAALTLAACGSDSGGSGTTSATASAADDSGAKLVKPGKLTTCTNVPYEPFQFNECEADKVKAC